MLFHKVHYTAIANSEFCGIKSVIRESLSELHSINNATPLACWTSAIGYSEACDWRAGVRHIFDKRTTDSYKCDKRRGAPSWVLTWNINAT